MLIIIKYGNRVLSFMKCRMVFTSFPGNRGWKNSEALKISQEVIGVDIYGDNGTENGQESNTKLEIFLKKKV